jgi:tetratricopeptide (TPR) repeat protein
VAINKRKILASAQRNIQKGALDKALKDYQSIVDADPRDTNVRLKIGDLQLKRNRPEEAIAAYLKVADQFMRDGFDAKAVALYKQVTKIDPKRHDIYVPLADLYQRLGLVSEAMDALQTVADAYHRDGRRREALDLMRRMARLDPTNTTNRLKVAELLHQEKLDEEALAEYAEASAELERQGDWEGRIGVLERMLELAPKRPEVLEGLAHLLFAHEQAGRAEPLARRLAEVDGERPEPHNLLGEILSALGREEEAGVAHRREAEIYRQRGDEDRAREIVQRSAPQSFDGNGGGASPLGGVAAAEAAPPALRSTEESPFGEEGIGGQPLSTDDPQLSATRGSVIEEEELELDPGLEEIEIDEAEAAAPAPPAPAAPKALPAPVVEPAADVEQIFAEANVYLRYGKHDRAIASLEAILGREPEHVGALEQLGQALDATGRGVEALEAWVRAARRAAEQGDVPRFEALRDRIAERDVSAAEALPEPAPPAADAEPPSLGDGANSLDLGREADEAPALDEHASDGAWVDDLEAGGGGSFEPSEEGIDPAALDEIEIEIDADAFAAHASPEPDRALEPEREPEAAEEPAGESTPAATAEEIQEGLGEAAFYFDQGMLEEAEALYRRVLEKAPNHPGAMLRLGEIAAARGEDPGVAPHDPETGSDTTERSDARAPDLGEVAESFEELEIEPPGDLDLTSPPDADREATADEPDTEPGDAAEAPPEAFDGDRLGDEIGAAFGDDGAIDELVPTPAPTPAPPSEDELRAAEAGAPAPAAAEESFDLAAELSDAFGEGERPPAPPEEDGFDAIFRDFKRGVSRALGDGDVETHFDLGIAYREMGLFDDAIGEFRYALASLDRRIDALHMMSLCALEVGRPQDAVAHLEQALASPDVPADRDTALRYDLGRAYEAAGDRDRALDCLRRVRERDGSFADVVERIQALESGTLAMERPDGDLAEAYESFDDLIAEAEGSGPGVQDAEPEPDEPEGDGGPEIPLCAETTVSFGEGGPRADEADAPPESVDSTEAEGPAPEADSAAGSPRRRKRRKVSFV